MTPQANPWPAVWDGPRRGWMVRLVANGLTQAVLAAAGGWCVHLALAASAEPVAGALVWPLSGLAASALALYALRAVERGDAQRVGQHFVGEVRELLFDRLLSMQPAQLASIRRGALTQRLVGDLRALRMWVSLGLARLIVGAAAAVMLLALLALAHPLLALAAGLAAGAVIGTAFAAGPQVRRAVRAERRQATRLGSNVNERVQHLALLVGGGRRSREQGRLRRLHESHTDAAVRLSWQLALLRYSGDLAVSAAGFALVASGSWLVAGGTLTPLAFASWVVVAGMMLPSLRETGLAIAHLQGARVSRERILAFLARAPQPAASTPPTAIPDAGGVDFDGVRLLPNATPLNARVGRGQVAVLDAAAPSLARRLLEVTAWLAAPAGGVVAIEGRPLADWPPEALRRRLRHVDGDAPLWRGTLEYNLRYLAPRASDEALARALRRCGLADWVDSLPGKLATRVFEGGGNLAPERRFQIALAAALLSRPQVLLVDDTRVALDADAERAVDEALARFAHGGGTVLRATSRPAARAAADLHLPLDAGPRADVTTHDDRAWLH